LETKKERRIGEMARINNKDSFVIAKSIINALIDQVPIKQQIIESMSQILNVNRCTVFKIFRGKNKKMFCGVFAGVPVNEYSIDVVESLNDHPDIKKVVDGRKILLVADPKENPLTSYFSQAIIKNNVNQILYIPLVFEKNSKRTIGVVVIDAIAERKAFNEEEIEFCAEVGGLISLILEREEVLIEEMRDKIINRVVGLGGFARRLKKINREFSKDVRIIIKEIKTVEKIFPRGEGKF